VHRTAGGIGHPSRSKWPWWAWRGHLLRVRAGKVKHGGVPACDPVAAASLCPAEPPCRRDGSPLPWPPWQSWRGWPPSGGTSIHRAPAGRPRAHHPLRSALLPALPLAPAAASDAAELPRRAFTGASFSPRGSGVGLFSW